MFFFGFNINDATLMVFVDERIGKQKLVIYFFKSIMLQIKCIQFSYLLLALSPKNLMILGNTPVSLPIRLLYGWTP